MLNRITLLCGLAVAVGWSAAGSSVSAAVISGHYLETRTCQVYTGPCFANSETGLAGREAVMAWSILDGQAAGTDLRGLKVVMAVHSDETLGHGGLRDARKLKAVIFVDDKATPAQRDALIDFAKTHSGPAGNAVVRISSAPIDMSLDEIRLLGRLHVGDDVQLTTRKAGLGDCICSNESAFYPPLAQVEYFAPGVTMVGEFKGRGLGVRWSTPDSRSAYMATFTYPSASTGEQVTQRPDR